MGKFDDLYDLWAGMDEKEGDDYDVLFEAIKDKFPEGQYSSNDLTMRFSRWPGGDREIREVSIFIEDINNVYHKEEGWKWEIFLNGDGTWRIS